MCDLICCFYINLSGYSLCCPMHGWVSPIVSSLPYIRWWNRSSSICWSESLLVGVLGFMVFEFNESSYIPNIFRIGYLLIILIHMQNNKPACPIMIDLLAPKVKWLIISFLFVVFLTDRPGRRQFLAMGSTIAPLLLMSYQTPTSCKTLLAMYLNVLTR